VTHVRPVRQVLLPRAQAVIGARQVGGDQILEAIRVAGLVGSADAAVRDQRVQAAALLVRAREGRAHGRGVAHVGGGDEGPLRAARGDLVRGALEPRRVARDERQPRSLAPQAQRDRAADAGARPRHQHVTTSETPCCTRHGARA
jgi:hypothetical protein